MDISSINSNLTNYMNSASKEVKQTEGFEDLLNQAIESKNKENLRSACKDFEGYFIQKVFTEMRKSIPESNLMEKSQGREIFEDMLYEEYAKNISTGRGIGLADMLYKQLSTKL